MQTVPSKRRARRSTSRHLENEEKHQNESEGQSCGNTRANLSTGISYRRHSRKASLGQKTSIGDYITYTETHLTPAEIAAVKAQALTIVKEENFKHITSRLDVNQPTLPHGLGSIFVTPPKILKRQLTGYCTSPASTPIGRDNKHGWHEKHEKFVAIAAGSLSSATWLRTANDPEANPDQQHYHPKHNRNRTDKQQTLPVWGGIGGSAVKKGARVKWAGHYY